MRTGLIALTLFAALATPAVAHPDHDEDEPEHVDPAQARSAVIRLITQARLDASWTKAVIVAQKDRQVKGAQQTVFTFRNSAERNKAKQTLYVILNGYGSLVSAEHVLR